MRERRKLSRPKRSGAADSKPHKAWAGRMVQPTHPLVESFTTSYPIDCRLYSFDIAGSIAHCRMLAKQKIIPSADAKKIVKALGEIRAEFEAGQFVVHPGDEDIHMAIERRLIEKIGPAGGKLHTARSRNDQVALDLRLYVRDAIDRLRDRIDAFIAALAELAERHLDAVMPGYTHLQQAQPVLFAHHLLAHVAMLQRDAARLADCRRRTNVLPLGSGALAGTTFPIDRAFVARELGFDSVSANSLDAVGDRDFAIELLAAGAILGMHLSRFCEEIVLWSSQEFAFLELPDAFATGSSMMPQKKNPDVAELIRGKSGRLNGNLVNLLTVLKGLPLAYNRDLQEDKAPVFDTVDTLLASLELLAEMVPRLGVRTERMRSAAAMGHTLATELADYVASKGVPFRDAHGVAAAAVRRAIESGRSLEDFPLAELREISPVFGCDVKSWLTLDAAVERRRAPGGTASGNVKKQLAALRRKTR